MPAGKELKQKSARTEKIPSAFKSIEVHTVIDTKIKFLENTLFVGKTKKINLLSDLTSLDLGLIKTDKSKHMCFNINNMKNGNTQKEEMKANKTKAFPTRLRRIIEKYKKVFFKIKLGIYKNIA